MAFQAKGPDVFEITFAAAFDHRNDVIGIPKAFSAHSAGTEAPVDESFQTGSTAQPLEVSPGLQAIDAALSANAPISFQYFFTDVSRVGSQAPFLYAPIRAERQATLGHLEIAPAAKTTAVWAFWKTITVGPTARHRSRSAQLSIIPFRPRALSNVDSVPSNF